VTDLQLFWADYKDQLLELNVKENSQTREPRNLNFNWLAIDFTEQQLMLKLEFEDALQISANSENDMLDIKFIAPDFFTDLNGNPVEEDTVV